MVTSHVIDYIRRCQIAHIDSPSTEPARTRTVARGASLLALPALLVVGNPAVALLAGGAIVLGLNRQPFACAGALGKYCLQAAIVLLGLRLDLGSVWSISTSYSWFVVAYAPVILATGLLAGRLFSAGPATTKLIASGTAICGGTAIATLGSVLRAKPHEMAVALAIVFLLNVVAIFTFPLAGQMLGLSQQQFGVWSALAIHDTSAVLATAASYGEEALEVATTLKLVRTLWLIPLIILFTLLETANQQLATGAVKQKKGFSLPVPSFILPFLLATAANTFVAFPQIVGDVAGSVSKALLVMALFFVGTQLTRDILGQIRGDVLWLAIGLWSFAVPATLILVLASV